MIGLWKHINGLQFNYFIFIRKNLNITCLGYGIAEILSFIGIPMPPPPGMETGFTAQINVTFTLAMDALALAFVTTLIASIMPAWKASRMNVVDALRCNQ